ncbi:helix-turn-helix domain-containing protein [Enterococcus dongliensis]|uniref:helix-turn-helix domain-containing protein n=1 Tax=Enterococcus dongliensis TaxID=2559925 RepID=UPI00289CFDAC|nr:helix-turn-helix domain-containing protein [Enterococcus dongliensis]
MALFYHLERLPEGDYTIKSISDELGYVYSTTQVLLNEMAADCSMINKEAVLFTPQKQIRCPLNGIAYDRYFAFLVHQGVPYQCLLYLLEHPQNDLRTFCHSHYVSIASCMRHLQPLAEYTQQFGITFNRSQLSMKGDERLIRITLFNLVWAVSKGSEPLFQHFQSGELTTTLATLSQEIPLGRDYVGTKEIHLFVEITYLRIKHGFYVEDDPRYDAIFSKESQLPLDALEQFFPVSKNQLYAEYRFLQFMQYYAPTYIGNDDPRLPMIQQYLAEKNPLSTILLSFESFWEKKVIRGDTAILKKNPDIHGNLHNVLVCYYIFPQKIPTLFNLLVYFQQSTSIHYEYLHQQITRFFTRFFTRFSKRSGFEWLQGCQSCLIDLFTWLTLAYFESTGQQQPLIVSLIMESNQLFRQCITQRLNDLSFVKLVPFSIHDVAEYDFLVCSSALLLPKDNNLPYFVFNFFSKNTDYTALYRTLRKQHQRKNISYRLQTGRPASAKK